MVQWTNVTLQAKKREHIEFSDSNIHFLANCSLSFLLSCLRKFSILICIYFGPVIFTFLFKDSFRTKIKHVAYLQLQICF